MSPARSALPFLRPAPRTGLVLALFLSAACQDQDPMAPGTERDPEGNPILLWSSPGTWPSRTLPAAGSTVTIPRGRTVRLDVSPPPLGGLVIEGTLEFARAELELTADWIRVAGALRIGSPDAPFSQKARITLTGPDGPEAITGMGNRVIGVLPEARLELHGEVRTAWTRLDATAPRGATQLTLAEPVDWRPGDRIVIAPSGFNPLEAEDRVITAVSGRTITVDRPLDHLHYGEIQQIAGRAVDQRAEVGLLTRNIVIRGPGVNDQGVRTDPSGFGGHVMILAGAIARIQGVEFLDMGQRGRLGHYPVHWHLAGEVSDQYIRHSSVWRSNNRCITVHGTRGLRLERNVCYDHPGHGYFLEEGAETGNELLGNLGVLTRRPAPADRVLPSDDRPATFWVTNPDNRLVGERGRRVPGDRLLVRPPHSAPGALRRAARSSPEDPPRGIPGECGPQQPAGRSVRGSRPPGGRSGGDRQLPPGAEPVGRRLPSGGGRLP